MSDINSLDSRISRLEAILGQGNFNSSTVQQKDAVFNGRFKLVNRAATPTYAAIGEICMAAGHLYVAKTLNTWTLIT